MSNYTITINNGGEPWSFRVTILCSVVGKGRLLAGFYDYKDALAYARKKAKKHECMVEDLCRVQELPGEKK